MRILLFIFLNKYYFRRFDQNISKYFPENKMSERTLPFLLVNLGGEMLYVLDQRLKTQVKPGIRICHILPVGSGAFRYRSVPKNAINFKYQAGNLSTSLLIIGFREILFVLEP